MNKCNSEIGLRLKAARQAAGFRSARNFAQKHHIPESTYAQHESGKRTLNVDTLKQYCELLSVDPNWIVSGHRNDGQELSRSRGKAEAINIAKLFLPEFQPENQPLLHVIELDLLTKILKAIAPFFSDKSIGLTTDELITFCYEVYNGIVNTSADQKSIETMIQLSASSLKRGLTKTFDSSSLDLVQSI